jgi:UDP-N-acetylglucosamine:LPS N-acetylglucosamine transferase
MVGGPDSTEHPVIILTAGVGAGHDGAARAWAERLAHAGYPVQIHDLLGVLRRRKGARVAAAYEAVLHRAPWLYELLFTVATRPIGVVVARALMGGALPRVADLLGVRRRRIHGVLRGRTPDQRPVGSPTAVLCTYPLAGHVLGELRRQGRLQAPVLTFLTDFSVHRLCVAPGVDAHLALHQVSADQAVACGGRPAVVCGPVVGERFHTPGPLRGLIESDTTAPVAAGRRRFGLPTGARLALLVAGSWGVGEVETTAAEIAATGVAVPVVVCGRNVGLRSRLVTAGTGIALGWITDMPALMRCVDVLVENAGGLTSLEAMAVGLPVASYRPIAGHGRTNAESLAAAGVTCYIRRSAELAPRLLELIDGDRGRLQRERGLALFDHDPVAALRSAMVSASDRRPACPDPKPATVPRIVLPAVRPTAVRIGGLARPVVTLILFVVAATVGGNTST